MLQRITARLLASKDACREQRDIFAKEWPGGAEVTLENCRRASSLGLDLAWAAQRLLSPPAWKAYQEAMATARKAYQEARATAFYAARLLDQPNNQDSPETESGETDRHDAE